MVSYLLLKMYLLNERIVTNLVFKFCIISIKALVLMINVDNNFILDGGQLTVLSGENEKHYIFNLFFFIFNLNLCVCVTCK